MIAMQESSGKYVGRIPPKIINPTCQSESSPFIAQKEASAPKTESVFNSKIVKTTVAFGTGFLAGYVPASFTFNPMHNLSDIAILTSAFVVGCANTARHTLMSETEIVNDNSAFIKWALPTAGFVYLMTLGLPIESAAIGSVFGVINVVKKRMKNKKEQK